MGIHRAALLLVAALAAVGTGGTTACGPSFQAVYECDVRFEHCYALDQGSAPPQAMKECWREWLRGYTYGQSRDRVEYAATRFSELSLDPTLPGEDLARPKRARGMVAPLPTSAFVPPPNLGADGRADGASPPAPPGSSPDRAGTVGPPRTVQVAAKAPGEECAGACAGRWTGCRKGCVDGACDACDRAYKECVPSCFQEVRQVPRSLR